MFFSSNVLYLKNTCTRSLQVSPDQAGNAAFAACTALSKSAAVLSGKLLITLPSAGLYTLMEDWPFRSKWPAMKF